MESVDYNADISEKLNTLPVGKVYAINPERADLEAFREAIKARIDQKGDFEFSADYTSFKRIKPFYDEVAEIPETCEPINWIGMVNAIHDTIQRELELKYPKKQWR